MRKKPALNKKNEFRSFFYLKIFTLIISCIIAFTFILRTLEEIKESSFNKSHYTILLIDQSAHIINIDLIKKKILIFDTDPKIIAYLTTRQAISLHLGIPIDSIIKAKNSKKRLDLSSEIKSLSFALSFFTSSNSFNLTNINQIDIIKIFFVSNFAVDNIDRVPLTNILGLSIEAKENTIKNESVLNKNRTLEIINASRFDGVAYQMSKMFNNIGYTTVATRTSTKKEKAKIIYRIDKDDTVDTIINLLEIPSSFDPKISIADISIVIDEEYAKKYLQLTE